MTTTINYGLTPEQQSNVRKEFQKLLDDLKTRSLEHYNEYINAPAAMSHHQNYRKGLLEHSGKFAMWLYSRAVNKNGYVNLTLEECVKIGFLHDFCKLFLYSLNENGKYSCDSSLYQHHGKLSVNIAKDLGYKLSQKEKICILLHMAGGWWNQEDEEALAKTDREWIGENIKILSAVQWADMKACE